LPGSSSSPAASSSCASSSFARYLSSLCSTSAALGLAGAVPVLAEPTARGALEPKAAARPRLAPPRPRARPRPRPCTATVSATPALLGRPASAARDAAGPATRLWMVGTAAGSEERRAMRPSARRSGCFAGPTAGTGCGSGSGSGSSARSLGRSPGLCCSGGVMGAELRRPCSLAFDAGELRGLATAGTGCRLPSMCLASRATASLVRPWRCPNLFAAAALDSSAPTVRLTVRVPPPGAGNATATSVGPSMVASPPRRAVSYCIDRTRYCIVVLTRGPRPRRMPHAASFITVLKCHTRLAQ
jgi:hypothetical protein